LIDYLFKVAVYLGATYLFYRYLLRDDVNFLGNRLFLLFMLPLSFLLPLAPLQSPFRALTFSAEALSAAAALPMVEAPAASLFGSIILVLYWTGVALFMLRILFHLFHLYRLQHRHPREQLHNITLVRVAAPIPPFSFFNRIFLHTPKNSDAREIEQIISHESVHIRQLHSLDILVMEVVVALQWFNPLVWFYRKALKETHEYLADREVIAQGFNADGYSLLLFEQQFGAKLFEFASHLKQSQIKRRMFMMNRMNKAGKAPYKIILALPLIALLALAEPRLILAQGATADDKKEVAQKQDKPAMSEQELKEFQIKFEEKEKIKQDLDTFYKKRQACLSQYGITPENEKPSKEELEKKLQAVHEKRLKLKQLAAEEKDQEKVKELKLKFEELVKLEEKLKSKIEESSPERP